LTVGFSVGLDLVGFFVGLEINLFWFFKYRMKTPGICLGLDLGLVFLGLDVFACFCTLASH
jgi:hypothetical protein